MIRGIHYSTELKTKIDVIPRGCFKVPISEIWGMDNSKVIEGTHLLDLRRFLNVPIITPNVLSMKTTEDNEILLHRQV